VLLKERRSRPPAVVSGAVRIPQQFQIYRQVRLLELLAYTGGVTDQANGTIEIFHTAPEVCPQTGATTTPTATAQHANATGENASATAQTENQDALQIPFDVYNLNDLRMGREGANPFIRPGDAVFVREASPVYVTGSVVSPQGVYLREGMTLMRAIASVGGLRREARASAVRIYRRRPNSTEPETIVANLNDIRRNRAPDIALQPYDIIDVSEASPFSSARIRDTLLGFVTNSVQTFGTNLPVRVLQ
jgi:polysaccharide export outer membrane protein